MGLAGRKIATSPRSTHHLGFLHLLLVSSRPIYDSWFMIYAYVKDIFCRIVG